MVLTETEEMLVIVAGAIVLMALISNILKDYRSMSRGGERSSPTRKRRSLCQGTQASN